MSEQNSELIKAYLMEFRHQMESELDDLEAGLIKDVNSPETEKHYSCDYCGILFTGKKTCPKRTDGHCECDVPEPGRVKKIPKSVHDSQTGELSEIRCRELMDQAGLPDSLPLKTVLYQLANETQQACMKSSPAANSDNGSEHESAVVDSDRLTLRERHIANWVLANGHKHRYAYSDRSEFVKLLLAEAPPTETPHKGTLEAMERKNAEIVRLKAEAECTETFVLEAQEKNKRLEAELEYCRETVRRVYAQVPMNKRDHFINTDRVDSEGRAIRGVK